jgi:hydrophobic/amphiphilic exporter-1 (mainly G- bacteria), HAE1 family
MKLSNISIDRPVFTTMCALAVVVMGVLSLFRLGVDLFPDVSFPVVAITTVYPGAGPEEVETQVTKQIEDAVSTINGVDTIRSYSRDSVSVVVVLFKLDTILLEANNDVRDRVQQVKFLLPKDAEDPSIQKFDPSAAPIMSYAVRGTRTPAEMRRFVDDEVRPLMESVEGVGSIVINGGAIREVQVDLDEAKLESVGLSVLTVAQILRAESFDLPGGRIETSGREFSIKAQGRFQSVSDVANIVLLQGADGSQIRVKDVGNVVDGVAEVRSLNRVNGETAVTFDIQKRSGGNTVAISVGVNKAMDKLIKNAPTDVQFTLIQNQAKYINNNIHRLREHLIIGGLLAILVIFFFMLDVRSTLISAVALPMSVIATFIVMWQLGFTLNIMSMLAITLSIGLLIDDSVVVRENIFRHLEMGADPMTAARRGTSEIALAVFATTMTIVAVFIPVAFMDGIIGKFFKQFGLTITAAVLVSLIISFTLDPMLSARLAQKVDPNRHENMAKHWLYGPPTRFFAWMDSAYRDLLKWALVHKFSVVGLAALMFFGSFGLVPLMGTEFFTRGDQSMFSLHMDMQPGVSLEESDAVARQAEVLLKKVEHVKDIITTVGVDRDVSKISILVLTTPLAERKMTMDTIMENARQAVKVLPGVTYDLGVPDLANNGAPQTAVQLIISGPDYVELQRLADKTLKLLQDTPGTRDVSMSLRPGSPEQRFVVDRNKAADRGVSFGAVAQALRFSVEGDEVATIADRGKDVKVRVRVQESDRNNADDLRALRVPNNRGGLVRIDEVITFKEQPTPSSIERSNRQRAVTLSANLNNRSLGEVLTDVQAGIDAMDKKPGYAFKFEGDAENMKDTFTNMLISLGLAIVFIYFILASQFESFVHPFTIMVALPLAVVGALAGLFLAGMPIGMPAMIGIILLMGLVTKNGILLVDYTNQVREKTGKSAVEALIEAGPTRLRPILMTSAAIVLGELPTAMSTAEGSEFNRPMATAVIGGVITSTFLTLLVVPVVYTWIDKLSKKKHGPLPHETSATTPTQFSTPAE